MQQERGCDEKDDGKRNLTCNEYMAKEATSSDVSHAVSIIAQDAMYVSPQKSGRG